jgi:hypothetical protein
VAEHWHRGVLAVGAAVYVRHRKYERAPGAAASGLGPSRVDRGDEEGTARPLAGLSPYERAIRARDDRLSGRRSQSHLDRASGFVARRRTIALDGHFLVDAFLARLRRGRAERVAEASSGA